MRISGVVSFKKSGICIFAFAISLLLVFCNVTYAQLCTGSLGDPVVKIDFGAGTATHAVALPAGQTNYTYSSADFPQDGSYTISNSTAGSGNVWWSTTDHTGNAGGYMMVVNASTSKTDYFYKTTVTGLCPGTTFEFAAWITNLLRSSDISPPNITFTIRTTGASPTVLASYNTGTIPITPGGREWKQYGTYFTTPAGVTAVEIQMTNNSNGGAPANDLALDDITFRPCGPAISSTMTRNGNTSTSQSVCIGALAQTYVLNSTIVAGGYTNPVYQWQSNNGSGWVNINGANSTSYTLNFQPTVAGTYQYRMVTAEAANGVNSACQVASNLLTFNVSAVPVANYTITEDNTSCLVNAYNFTSTSTPGSGNIVSWLWNFGDGATSNLANPTHTYTNFGDFDIKLTVINSGGCSATFAKLTTIKPKLLARFSVPAQSCPTMPVAFTDQSIISSGTIKEWKWNFGDQSPEYKTNTNVPPAHVYASAGTYKASLQITSSADCVSDVYYADVVILPAPTPDFILPDACVTDAVQFMDNTTVAGGSALPVIYKWDFGDAANATITNPNTSTAKNPVHKFSSPGVYTVTLTVDGQNGCGAGTIQKQFTVNSALPTASFTVQNSNSLCSGTPVSIVNTSTLSFGNITRLDVYYNFIDSPTVVKQFLRSKGEIPADGVLPARAYESFSSAVSKTYTIRMIAYSGASCISAPFDQDITIYAKPVITLTKPASGVCLDGAAVQIVEDKGIFSGTGVFTGTGISSAGLFDPAVAGVGTFPINYTFTSSVSGCTYQENFNITVSPLPVITIANTINVLEGESVRVNPSVSGSNLKFEWSPASGVSDFTILNPLFTPTSNITYTLTVTSDTSGCTSSAQVAISVLKTPVVPNAFTPNNDGINDTWEIKYIETYPDVVVEVYNRYGTRVFRSVGYSKPWDGVLNGAVLPLGVYYYVIKPGNNRKPFTGSVTIIK